MRTYETGASPSAVELSCRVVSAYVSGNAVPPDRLPSLIAEVHAILVGERPAALQPSSPAQPGSAQIQASLGPGGIMSFETGKRYTSLRRHLSSLGMSPTAYRRKWGLPSDYPMVCPDYSARRSAIAKGIGLGQLTPHREARSANG